MLFFFFFFYTQLTPKTKDHSRSNYTFTHFLSSDTLIRERGREGEGIRVGEGGRGGGGHTDRQTEIETTDDVQ